jgi:hypothetical protein
VLVLVRREVAARVTEPAAQTDVLRVLLRRPVERLGDRRTPVDHHRVAAGVVDMTAADVEALTLLRGVQIVEATEEERGVGEVGERPDALVDLRAKHGGVDPIRGDVTDVEGLDVLAHRAQGVAGCGQMGAFAPQWIRFGDVRGHGLPPADAAWITTWRTGRFPSGRRHSSGEAGRRASVVRERIAGERFKVLSGRSGRISERPAVERLMSLRRVQMQGGGGRHGDRRQRRVGVPPVPEGLRGSACQGTRARQDRPDRA